MIRYTAVCFLLQGKRAVLSITTGCSKAALSPFGLNGDVNVALWPIQVSVWTKEKDSAKFNGHNCVQIQYFNFNSSVIKKSMSTHEQQDVCARFKKIIENGHWNMSAAILRVDGKLYHQALSTNFKNCFKFTEEMNTNIVIYNKNDYHI